MKSSLVAVNRLIERFTNVLAVVSSILMVVLTIVVFLDVFSRYIFNLPFTFTGELTALIFPWIVFFGTVIITKNDENVAITVFKEKCFAGKSGKYADLIIYLIMIFFSVFLIKSSFDLSVSVYRQTLPILGISKSWMYISETFAFCLVLLILIYKAILLFFDEKNMEEQQ
jgi:TRAP-type C4-dicarboxylate transport system permease small subunit